MTLEQCIAQARKCGFRKPELLRKLALPAFALHPGEPTTSDRSGSRLGGLPVLSPTQAWPMRDGRALAFVAQIDLAQQPESVAALGLPQVGLLEFFYDAEGGTWGFDPKDAGSFAVIHVAQPEIAQVAADYPDSLAEESRFRACRLEAEHVWTFPQSDNFTVIELELAEEQEDAYNDFLDALSENIPQGSRGLLGGHPDVIQNDMMLECAMVSGGLYAGDASGYQDPRMPEFVVEAQQWRLLLQVPSAEASGMMWGDLGSLYYCMREADIRARRFDRAWMVLQCS